MPSLKRSKELQNSSSLESPWKSHVQDIVTKASKKCISWGLAGKRISATYCTKIRWVLEYATPIIWAGLRHYLKEDIERVQNWCLDIGLYTEEYNWVARIKKEQAKNIIAYRIQKITHVKIISGTNGHIV
jgi:hypothetical protein